MHDPRVDEHDGCNSSHYLASISSMMRPRHGSKRQAAGRDL